jgi:hypothetical protein
VSARIRAGSKFERFLCFALIDVRCLRVPPGIRVPQVGDHCRRARVAGGRTHCELIVILAAKWKTGCRYSRGAL